LFFRLGKPPGTPQQTFLCAFAPRIHRNPFIYIQLSQKLFCTNLHQSARIGTNWHESGRFGTLSHDPGRCGPIRAVLGRLWIEGTTGVRVDPKKRFC
jgi:hypothetical protein